MTQEKQSEKLGFGTLVGYGLGDFGGSVAFQTVTLFVLYFFTDVFLIGATAAGGILAAAKLWNAVCDPLVGFLSDRMHSRFGKKRPFLLFAAAPLGISFFLLFFAPDFSPTIKIVWGVATFLFFSTCYSLVGVPYGALTTIITTNDGERAKLTAWRMTFAILAILSIAGATKPVVALFGTPVEGFRVIGVVYGAVAAFFTWITFVSTKEKQALDRGDEPGFFQSAGIAKKNRPFILLTISIILHMTAINVTALMVNYYFKYNLKNEQGVTFAFLALFVTAAVGLPLWVQIQKKTGKRNAFNAGMALIACVLLVMFLIPSPSFGLVIGLFVITGFGMSTVYLFPWTMVPDTIDYSARVTGLRLEGFLYGIFYFAFKAAAALAGLLSGTGLELSGYVANADQSVSALFGIRTLITLVPVALIAGGVAVLSFYKLGAPGEASTDSV